MDFDAIINNLLTNGETPESIAKLFTEGLNKITAANKRKAEVEEYIDDAREAIYEALEGEVDFDFTIAAKAQVIAAAAYRPDLSLKDLREMESAFAEATKWSTELYDDIKKEAPKVVRTISDDDKILKFLRELG